MKNLPQSQALDLLQTLLERRKNLPTYGGKGEHVRDWIEWSDSVSETIGWIFSGKAERRREILDEISPFLTRIKRAGWAEICHQDSEDVRVRLERLAAEVQHTWARESAGAGSGRTKVFIVHGHSEGPKHKVARFISELGLVPIILDEQPGAGMSILSKLEKHSEVDFAIILLTADDVGKAVSSNELQPRARQNVILELGYFLGKLGKERTVAINFGVEVPSDYSGIVYIDVRNEWKVQLRSELNSAGFVI